MIHEPWFSLALLPQHITRAYQNYVRSVFLYGAELLNHEDRQQLYDLDAKMLNTLIGNLLKLERLKLSDKHRYRFKLAIGLPSIKMELDLLVPSRIDTWLAKHPEKDEKIAHHAAE